MNRNEKVLPLKYDSVRNDLFVEFELDQIYELRISCDFKEFDLGLPDGSRIHDIIEHLSNHEKVIRRHENSLYDFLIATIRSHKLRTHMKNEWKSVDLPFEGHRYRLEINPSNAKLKLHMPEYMIFADRSRLIDSFPELLNMEHGTIQNILLDQIAEAQPIRVATSETIPKSTLPIQVVKPKEFLIGKYYYRVQYIFGRDACFVHVPDRTIETSCQEIVRDIPELKDLHGDKLLYAIVNEVDKYGLQISR